MDDISCPILENQVIYGEYHRIVFFAPHITQSAKPGQFVHVKIDDGKEQILRRPFSICDINRKTDNLVLVYKVVGIGTKKLSSLPIGAKCSILGPLGTAYTIQEDAYPVIVVGGYGSASTLFLANTLSRKGHFFMGARTKKDLILLGKYQESLWNVEIATNDGSLGYKGFVTEPLIHFLDSTNQKIKIYACGPAPMLYAVAKLANERNILCDVSMDQHMGCGVGACFACVIKVLDSSNQGWRYSRSCKEGVVYSSKEVYCG